MEVDGSVGKMAAGAGTRAVVDVENCEVLLQLGVHAKGLGIYFSPDPSQATAAFLHTEKYVISCENAIHHLELLSLWLQTRRTLYSRRDSDII
jgi:hypothetical protein